MLLELRVENLLLIDRAELRFGPGLNAITGETGAGEIVLGRRVSAEGRTRAFVQGRSATAADLQAVGGRLLSFYGQHEHRRLTVGSAQLEILDAFCGHKHLELRERYAERHRRASELRRELEELFARAGARDRDRDLLAFELAEIDELEPRPDEEDELL